MKLVWNEYFTYEDGNLYWKKTTTNRVKVGTKVGSDNNNGYLETSLLNRRLLVHRVVYELHNGDIPAGLYVDHINGDRSDNRVDNLRLADTYGNASNAKTPRNNKSGYKGVCFDNRRAKWRAHITHHKKHIFLGYFDCPQEAHNAYLSAAEVHHKEFKRDEA